MAASDRVVLVVGAGDYIGSAIAERFARGGYQIVAARRNKTGDKLEPLRVSIESAGGVCHCMTTDARKEEQVTELFERTERDIGPVEVCVFNVGGNVRFPLADTTTRVFYKVWEMACFAGFLTGREAAKYMVPRGVRVDLFHRRYRKCSRWERICGFRECEIGTTRAGSEHGARAGAKKHPRQSSGHRRRGRHRVCAKSDAQRDG